MGCCLCVQESNLGVSERWGRYEELLEPGCFCMNPISVKVHSLSTRISQLHVIVDSTTHDKVFVKINVQVQFRVNKEKAYDAFYSLKNVNEQIKSYIIDSVRDKIPERTLDTLMREKRQVAESIDEELGHQMAAFGYEIIKVLLLEIEPEKGVKEAMNDINMAERQRTAALAKAEASKILKIKEAEAEAEARALAGKGVADARKAIVEGLKECVNDFADSIPGAQPNDIMNLVLTTQYYDCLKEVGSRNHSNVIFLPPGQFHNIDSAFLASNLLNKQS